jgi:hypothetical protein
VFCKGVCGRAFHNLCWGSFLKGDELMVEGINLKEMGMRFTTWAGQLSRGEYCRDCKEGSSICFCSICGQEGMVDEEGTA